MTPETQHTNSGDGFTITGLLSGKTIRIPPANKPPMPDIGPSGIVHEATPAEAFRIDPARGYPDVRSFGRKFGLVIPATNTSMEHDLWSIVFRNQKAKGLRGVGLHTACVVTPKPQLHTEADLLEYQKQFLGGLKAAVDTALLAQPEYMIMGMSLEHILAGLDDIRAPVSEIEAYSGLSWAVWHDAIAAALGKYGCETNRPF